MSVTDSALERYLVQEKLGEGGFGRVYLGYDKLLKRQIAVKLLPKDQDALYEAKLLASLKHENIVILHDAIEGKNYHYLIMEYVRAVPIHKRKWSLSQVLDLGIQICQGLEHAHYHGICHLDIKPSNLLVDEHLTCKITDFGIARSNCQQSPLRAGTPEYMAPEQTHGSADGRADIYSVGKVLKSLITNLDEPIPHRLGAILAKATHRDPSSRWDTVAQLRRELEELAGTLGRYQQFEQILPDFGEGWQMIEQQIGRINPVSIGRVWRFLLPFGAMTLALRVPLLAELGYYQPIFAQLIGPLVVGFLGLFSLKLSWLFWGMLMFPVTVLAFPTLGWLLTLSFICTLPLIWRLPLLGLAAVYAAFLPVPLVMICLVLLFAYYQGPLSGIVGGFLFPLVRFGTEQIAVTESYLSILDSPLLESNSFWLWETITKVEGSELVEILGIFPAFVGSEPFVIGVFLITVATVLGLARGLRGGSLFGLFLGTVLALVFPQVPLWEWMIGYALFYCCTLLKTSIEQDRTKEIKKHKPDGSSGRVLV